MADMVGTVAGLIDTAGMVGMAGTAADMLGSGSTMYVIRLERS